jgi:hypothetical protein
MTERKKNPGALAGASGAGKPIQRTSEGHQTVAHHKRAVTPTVAPHASCTEDCGSVSGIQKRMPMVKSVIPPKNAKRIYRVADLPQNRKTAEYEVRSVGSEPKIVKLCKRQRQIMDLLIEAPVYCASPVRISDAVHILKREIAIDVHTAMYAGNENTGSGSYGVYFLNTNVRLLNDEVAE